jgi:ATP phosphoribosyltransferase regulatory subunit
VANIISPNFGLAPERTARRNAVEQAVIAVFTQYGYREISLPVYEYYDALKNVAHDLRDEDIISFTDRASGKQLVLRPDFTPQVCRMVAGYCDDFPLPIKLFYRGPIFRNVNIEDGAKAEKYQIGCEMSTSADSAEMDGDLELLLCAMNCMAKINLRDYRIVFGDASYLSRVLEIVGKSAAEYMDILKNKRLYAVRSFLDRQNLSDDVKALLSYLPISFGGKDEFKRLKDLSAFDPELKGRLDYMKALFDKALECGFSGDRLVFDASEMRGLDYYTGVSFEILHTSSGAILGGGGRYDKLMKKFGLDYTACGMALSLTELELLV